MNHHKNLFDLFRENQHKLDERPPLHTWRRLEQRLDKHQRRGRISLYRSLAMVAGILALAVLIILMTLVVDQQQEYLTGTPHQLEDLQPSEADNATAYLVVEFTRTYQDRMTKPIEEGTPNKKLVPVDKEN
jgi:cytoskeletal protein RodZ